MVEFAIIAVLFFMLIFAIIQGGIMFGSWIVVTNAAREGARFASPCISRAELPSTIATPCTPGSWNTENDIKQRIKDYVKQRIAWPDPENPAFGPIADGIDVTYDPKTANPRLVYVRITYQVPVLVPLMGIVMSDPVLLSAESDMRIES